MPSSGREDLRSKLEDLFSDLEEPAGSESAAPAQWSEDLLSEPTESEAERAGWVVAALRRVLRCVAGLLRPDRGDSESHDAVNGSLTLLVLLFFGVLIGWKSGSYLGAEPPAVEARVLSSPSPYPSAASLVAVSSPTPRPTWTLAPSLTPSPTASPTAIPSPTPSPLSSPAALVIPSPFPEPGLPPSPTVSSTLPIPTPVSPVPVAADAINIVVLGSDRRPDWSQWHTDAVHVVSIQTDRPAASVLSIPRDLYVYIPGFWMSRINFADFYGESYGREGGGIGLVEDTFLYNLGIQADHVVRTDFDGLIGIVDTLGGIDVAVHCRLSDHWPYPNEDGEYPILTLEPGMHHMDGEMALWYARSRMTTSVFSRERRQQQVLQAIWHKARDAEMLTQIPALWSQVRSMVVTDMNLVDLVRLAEVALRLSDQNVRFYNIGVDAVTPWTTPYGGAVFLPRWEAIEPTVAEAMAPIPETRLSRTFMPVEVWNGTPNAGLDLLAADRLGRAGFPA
ncbi:MAG: LCP family protein, partial [Anaerolineae bacterium]